MRKISNLNEQSRIDTSKGDIDEFIETRWSSLVRAVTDSRTKALSLLMLKFNEIRELTRFITESGKFIEYLYTFRTALIKSKEGLTLYKNNERYREDKEIRSTVEHILEDEIPSHIIFIDEFIQKSDIKQIDIPNFDN